MVLALLRKEADDIREQWANGEGWTEASKHAVAVREDIANLTYEELMEGLKEEDDDDQ